MFYMLTQNEAGTLLPPTGELYPSYLIQALSHLKAAANLLDDQSAHIPKQLQKRLYNLLATSRDTVWEIYHDCTDAVCLFLIPESHE